MFRTARYLKAALIGVGFLLLIVLLQRAGTALVVSVPLENPDAIVMLASHEWERLPAAAALGRQSRTARVILTVPASPTYWNCFRCSERVEWLQDEGIDRPRIVELRGVTNTYEEARLTIDYLAAARLSRLVIVTSAYHSKRALATFESLASGSAIAIGVSPAVVNSSATPARWWRYELDRGYVAYEWTALGAYAIRYGVWPF